MVVGPTQRAPNLHELMRVNKFVLRDCAMEIRRFELLIPCLQGRCSPSWAIPPQSRIVKLSMTLKTTQTFAWVAIKQHKTLYVLLRKEVIQPHLPIRLPCYDFTPVIDPTFGACLFTVSSATSGITNFHGVTGGVYKTRERIHRDMLIRDY